MELTPINAQPEPVTTSDTAWLFQEELAVRALGGVLKIVLVTVENSSAASRTKAVLGTPRRRKAEPWSPGDDRGSAQQQHPDESDDRSEPSVV